MKSIISYLRKTTLTELEKVRKAVKESPVCNTMCNLDESEINGEIRIFLNPFNQKCFNHGWFSHQDFYDWTQGIGAIVKGDTEEDKRKFWEVAVFEVQHDFGWSVGYDMKHFDLIDENYRIESKAGYGLGRSIKTPLKITKTNHAEIIGKVFGDISSYYSDTELTHDSRLYTKIQSEIIGAKQVLYMLGCGFYGASNLPTEVENLSWIGEVCIHKAVYLYFKKNNVVLPDFDFVYNYKNNKGFV